MEIACFSAFFVMSSALEHCILKTLPDGCHEHPSLVPPEYAHMMDGAKVVLSQSCKLDGVHICAKINLLAVCTYMVESYLACYQKTH